MTEQERDLIRGCKSDSEQLLAYTKFLRDELHLNISDTWVESYVKNKQVLTEEEKEKNKIDE